MKKQIITVIGGTEPQGGSAALISLAKDIARIARRTNFRRVAVAGSALACLLLLPPTARAQETDKLPNYVPVLPSTKARAFVIDPQKGYLVQQVKPDVYVIADGAYQSVFVTTGQGVILFDAPPTFGAKITQAVKEVTQEPITLLVYSHSHVDHTAGATVLIKEWPKLQILAEEGVASYLREKKDPLRPTPTQTFKDHRTLKIGTATVELKKGNWHSPEGDLFIYFAGKKLLMAVDTLAPGYVPFQDFDLTMNMHAYLGMFDQLLAYDFDTLVTGHLTSLGNRDDVKITKDYAIDVYKTVKRIHDGSDKTMLFSEAVAKYAADNRFGLFKTVLDDVVERATKEVQGRWIGKLAAVDVYTPSHCRAMLTYVRWDD